MDYLFRLARGRFVTIACFQWLQTNAYVTALNLAFNSFHLEGLCTMLHLLCCYYLVEAFSEAVEGCFFASSG